MGRRRRRHRRMVERHIDHRHAQTKGSPHLPEGILSPRGRQELVMDTEQTSPNSAPEYKEATLTPELQGEDLRGRIPLDANELLRAAESLETSELLGQQRALDA